MYTGTKAIADKEQDVEGWLAARMSRVTASDMFSYVTDGNPPQGYEWWDTTADHVEGEKLRGEPREFTAQDLVHMNIGSAAEPFVIDLARKEFLVDIRGTGCLFGNDRWDHIGASPDGFIWPDRSLREATEAPDGSSIVCAQDRKKNLAVLDVLHGPDGPSEEKPWVFEAKFSPAAKWQKEVPLYYVYQVQTQLHVLDLDNAVIAAITLKKRKYKEDKFVRTRWDFKAYHIKRDERFAKTIDLANERFGKAKGVIK